MTSLQRILARAAVRKFRSETKESNACSADPDCPKCAGQKRRGDGAEGRALFLVGSSLDLARGPYDQ